MVEYIKVTKGPLAGTEYERKGKRILIPSKSQYQETLKNLAESDNMKTLLAVRMGCELGLSRIEICNAEVSNIDHDHKRGLWIQIAKKVRRGSKKDKTGIIHPNFVMRSREIPINVNLYAFLKNYINRDQKYILIRERGDINKPFKPLNINYLYERSNISWSSHKSRHYFKSQVWSWMMENQRVDPGLLKELLGHKKETTEDYGEYSWDYKLGVIDKVFS